MKKSRDYDSYDEEEDREEVEVENREEGLGGRGKVGTFTGQRDDLEEEELSGSEDEEGDGDEEGEEGGITWFADGCRAFRIAFKSIMKIGVDDYDPLGPVLSARKKFVALRSLPRRKLKRKVSKEIKKLSIWWKRRDMRSLQAILSPMKKFL